MDASAGIVIVGASLAGLTTAETLREEGYGGRIALIGAEVHPPYHRPTLSKQLLTGLWGPKQATIRDADYLAGLDLQLQLGTVATSLDVDARLVNVIGQHGGPAEGIAYNELVIATGLRARRLPEACGFGNVHVIRTINDVLNLHNGLDGYRRVAVIGTGILGCELAAALRPMVREVTIIGRSAAIRFGELGGVVARNIAELFSEHNVRIHLGADVAEFLGESQVCALRLRDGTVVPVDAVLLAIGSTPAVDWLEGSGLTLLDGVSCDEGGQAGPHVYAAGDVARWGPAPRAEHQLSAIQQAQAVARRIIRGDTADPIIPFYWSELFGTKILVYGRAGKNARLDIIAGHADSGRFVAAWSRRGTTVGLVGWNMPREFREARKQLFPERTSLA